MMDESIESDARSAPYPHDGSEIIGASKPLGKAFYRCVRGNCGVPLGKPSDQDQHNSDHHMTPTYDPKMPTRDYTTEMWDDL